nr:MAG TPA: hypothetical protein [Caudoviricetes sp.]
MGLFFVNKKIKHQRFPILLMSMGDVFPQLYIISMKRRPIQKLFNIN